MSGILRRIGGPGARPSAPPSPWLLLLCGSFCGYFLLLTYCDIVRPANAGFVMAPSPGSAATVVFVTPGSPAARAGMLVGDRIVSLNGARLLSVRARKDIGVNAVLGRNAMVVERDGTELELVLTLEPAPRSFWTARAGATLIVVRVAQALMLASGLVIVARRPHDPVALRAAWFLLTCGVFTIALPWRLASVWRALPLPVGLLLLIPHASGLVIGPVLLTFVAAFPRRFRHAGYIQAVTWLVASAALAMPLVHFFDLVWGSRALRTIGPVARPLLAVTCASIAAAVVIVVVNYRRIDDVSERRRVRAVVAGLALGIIPGFPIVAWYWYRGSGDLATSIFDSGVLAYAAVIMLSLPLSFTYALLRHRLFDVSFIIRQGLRYALARRLLLSLLPALAAVLVVDLLAHGHETLNMLLRRRAPVYGAIGAAGFAIYTWRHRWLDGLDRRFFRERRDGYAMLRDVAEHLRRSGRLDRVAPRVVATIESAIHPEFAALLAHHRAESLFRTVAAAPAANAVPDLAADSKLVALARVLERPLDASEDGGGALLRQLPPRDREFIERAGIDLIVPVVTPDDQLYGLLALGRKRSEEPYSHEDRDVLATIAENVALLADRSWPDRERPTLEECLECGECFDAGMKMCERDGRPLIARGLPRVLAGRYRLDRRIAAGGMGTVYDTLDTALDRRVATKVIREDVAATAGATERFFDEGRLAARLMHPNVVTVHDFGMVDGRQPFLVMELLVGRTLRHHLETARELPPSMMLAVLDGVCAAVDAAHQLRLVHRDLKPENIFLVDDRGRTIPKVLDFGVAKALLSSGDPAGTATTPGVLLGTPGYMCPEQLRGEPPTRAWDLWSIAVIALEMLTAPAVSALSEAPTIRAAPPPAGGAWDPGAHIGLTWPRCGEFFGRALSVNPAERPPDAVTLLLQLDQALRADGIVRERAGHDRHDHLRALRN